MDLFSSVPAFKESRLRSLYLDFSHLKDVNPEGYAANVDAWVELLAQLLVQHTLGASIALPGARLGPALRNAQYGEPKALAAVLQAQIAQAKLVPWSIYLRWPVHKLTFADYVSPLRWALRAWSGVKMGSFAVAHNGVLRDEHYVSWDQLVDVGARVAAHLQKATGDGTYSGRLLTRDMFAHLARQACVLSDVDVSLLLVYLSRDVGRISVGSSTQHPLREYVKVGGALVPEDYDVINVKAQIAELESRVAALEQQVDVALPQRVQALVKSGAADERVKRVLLQKRRVAKSLTQAADVLGQLLAVLDKINDAQSNAAIVDSLKTAQTALSAFNARVSLDDVDAVRAELDEQMGVTDEISDALALLPDMDAELDEELEKLEAAVKTEKSKAEKKTEESKAEESKTELGKTELGKTELGETEKEEKGTTDTEASDNKSAQPRVDAAPEATDTDPHFVEQQLDKLTQKVHDLLLQKDEERPLPA